jgi:raffinose/stachyose/melibiose transport system permease protein
MGYFRSAANSLLITGAAVLVLILAANAAAYAIVRRGGRLYNGLYLLFLAGMFVPFQLCMIPLYKLMLALRLVNTYHGIIAVYIALQIPFSIFLFSGFIRSLPLELEEAAIIDGCGLYRGGHQELRAPRPP